MNSYLQKMICLGAGVIALLIPSLSDAKVQKPNARVQKRDVKAQKPKAKAKPKATYKTSSDCSSSSSTSSSSTTDCSSSTSSSSTTDCSTSSSSSTSSCSSSSSSSNCSTKSAPEVCDIQAPPYIVIEDGKPVMKMAVLNRSTAVSQELLNNILEAVKKQVVEDFAPFYGIYVKFSVFEDQDCVDWQSYAPLIIDDYLPESAGCDFVSFHALQTDNDNGFPISEAVFNPPSIPNGYPYIVVAIGDDSTCYGVTPVLNLGLPFYPETFAGACSRSISHQVLETLHDYTTNLVTLDFSEKFFGPNTIAGFFNEVCDPVQFSRGYKICGLNMANFVLPSYWVNDLTTGPFDFLGVVKEPFTPYGGSQLLLLTQPCGTDFFRIVSLPPCEGDPEDFELFSFPVFSCDNTVTSKTPLFLKGVKPRKAVIRQSAQDKAKTHIHAYRPYNFSAQKLARKAA